VRVINRLSYNESCWFQLDRNCHYQTSTTTEVVDDNAYSCASSPSWIGTKVADGHNFSVVRRLSQRILDRSKNAIFTYPTCIWRPWWGDPIRISQRSFALKNSILSAIVWRCLSDPIRLAILVQLWLVTDRQTRDDSKYCASIASRV